VLCALLAVLAVGCGSTGAVSGGQVQLTVTRNFGEQPVVSVPPVEVRGSSSALDLLRRAAHVTTGSRGGVASIDGVAGTWQLFVNGVRATPSSAEANPGDRVWWDLRPRGVARSIRAVVGSFPEPFRHGIGGKRVPTRVECADPSSAACDATADKLTSLGVLAARGGINAGVNDETLRVLVGPWSALRGRDDLTARVDAGPAQSGIYARFDRAGAHLDVLDADGRTARTLGPGTGLVAATRIEDHEPVWLVTGTDEQGVESAARALDEGALSDAYALAVNKDRGVAVPAVGGS
jgi:hypothetical protein